MSQEFQVGITALSFLCYVGAGVTCYFSTTSKQMSLADAVNTVITLVFFISFAFFLQRWVH